MRNPTTAPVGWRPRNGRSMTQFKFQSLGTSKISGILLNLRPRSSDPGFYYLISGVQKLNNLEDRSQWKKRMPSSRERGGELIFPLHLSSAWTSPYTKGRSHTHRSPTDTPTSPANTEQCYTHSLDILNLVKLAWKIN